VEDLARMAELMQAGEVTAVIDRSFPLAQAGQAVGYYERDRPRGKVVVAVAGKE
jgi:NADPH:quinone reductase-like Zn-dependent oxidoreductase